MASHAVVYETLGSKAPIKEALIDVRAAATADLSALRALAAELVQRYPLLTERVQWGMQMSLAAGEAHATAAPPTPTGLLLYTEDRSKAVQLRQDGFAVSQLEPYESWERLLEVVRELWPLYAAAARSRNVTRIAVRYINRLELPGGPPLSHWFDVLPLVPASVGSEPAEFYLRTVHLRVEDGAISVLQLAQELRRPTDPRVVLLDLDCFFDGLDLEPASDELWQRLDGLRERKNGLFFGSVTTATRQHLLSVEEVS